MAEPVPLAEVLRLRLPQLRDLAGVSQEHLAQAARQVGLRWSRSTVAEVETGQRRLTVEELLALPFLLDAAARLAMPGIDSYEVSLAELVGPGSSGKVALAPGLALSGRAVTAWLGEYPPKAARKAGRAAVSETDRHAARALGVPVEAVVAAAERAWGRSLTSERDHRAEAAGAGAMANRSRQALRGRVTRDLLKELAPLVKET